MARWFERPRIYYDWALYGHDLDADYARHVVQKALDVHADTLAFCTVLGGYALWPSDVTPQRGIKLHLATPAPVRSVRGLLGGSPTSVTAQDGVEIHLPRLDLYEWLAVEYGR